MYIHILHKFFKAYFKKINMHTFPSRIRACIIGFLIATVFPNAFSAEGPVTDLPRYVGSLKSIQSATVVLVPLDQDFRNILTERQLLDIGCSYTTNNASDIANLKNILGEADLKPSSGKMSGQQFDVRYGIFLLLQNHTEIKFLFGESYSGLVRVGGTLTRANELEGADFSAAASLSQDLIKWTKSAKFSNQEKLSSRDKLTMCGA